MQYIMTKIMVNQNRGHIMETLSLSEAKMKLSEFEWDAVVVVHRFSCQNGKRSVLLKSWVGYPVVAS